MSCLPSQLGKCLLLPFQGPASRNLQQSPHSPPPGSLHRMSSCWLQVCLYHLKRSQGRDCFAFIFTFYPSAHSLAQGGVAINVCWSKWMDDRSHDSKPCLFNCKPDRAPHPLAASMTASNSKPPSCSPWRKSGWVVEVVTRPEGARTIVINM